MSLPVFIFRQIFVYSCTKKEKQVLNMKEYVLWEQRDILYFDWNKTSSCSTYNTTYCEISIIYFTLTDSFEFRVVSKKEWKYTNRHKNRSVMMECIFNVDKFSTTDAIIQQKRKKKRSNFDDIDSKEEKKKIVNSVQNSSNFSFNFFFSFSNV